MVDLTDRLKMSLVVRLLEIYDKNTICGSIGKPEITCSNGASYASMFHQEVVIRVLFFLLWKLNFSKICSKFSDDIAFIAIATLYLGEPCAKHFESSFHFYLFFLLFSTQYSSS